MILQISSLLLAAVLGLGQTAFAQSMDSTEAVPGVAELKQQIFDLAKSFEGQPDHNGSKKQRLQHLIDQLLAITPSKTMEEKAATAVGAWQQVWGPYSYNDSTVGGSLLDPKNIFQIISPSGYYSNVGIYKVLGLKIIGILKGRYTVQPNEIAVQFVENGILTQKVPKGYSLADLPALHEQGRISVLDFPSIFPPVGIRGDLIEIYSDDTMRLTYGLQEGQKGETLYVMRRVKALNY